MFRKLFKRKNPKALGVLLCYNDADILAQNIEHLLENEHHIIAWDHGSDDDTAAILDKYNQHLIERKFIPREFDFYNLYLEMSKNLIKNYINKYDWISWPDQDEILEGPSREKRYYEFLKEVYQSKYDWIQFNNFNYWFTEKDDMSLTSPLERVKYYCLFATCSPRIRSWRASTTNLREFNHNPTSGIKFPSNFNLRHYPMRSLQQMNKRLKKDRAGLQRGGLNYHYNNMLQNPERLLIKSSQLHYDDGTSELNLNLIFPWEDIYGNATNTRIK